MGGSIMVREVLTYQLSRLLCLNRTFEARSAVVETRTTSFLIWMTRLVRPEEPDCPPAVPGNDGTQEEEPNPQPAFLLLWSDDSSSLEAELRWAERLSSARCGSHHATLSNKVPGTSAE